MPDLVTPQEAALTLFRTIAFAEGKNISVGSITHANAPTREWILWTYAQCLQTVLNPQAAADIVTWPIPK